MKPKLLVNHANQLVMKPPVGKPVIVPGRFTLDAQNQLVYWLNAPSAWRQYRVEDKIAFKGKWRLTQNHDLELVLQKGTLTDVGVLTLRGSIISVSSHTLIFEISSRDSQNQSHIQLFKLTGHWFANENNQLCFSVAGSTVENTLVFQAQWRINSAHEIEYSYRKQNLKTKSVSHETLAFSGWWQITAENRLGYILSRTDDSKFEFRVQAQSPSLYPHDNAIRYRIGVGSKVAKQTTLRLYGEWKFNRAGGIEFVIAQTKRSGYSITFNTRINLGDHNTILFSLLTPDNKNLGLRLEASHEFLKKYDAKIFIRLSKNAKESEIELGGRIPF